MSEVSYTKVESIYVAASSKDIERAKHWIEHLALAGIHVTSTWIASIEKAGSANPRSTADADQRSARWGYADENVRCIEQAQVLWLLVPPHDKPTIGAWYEAGVADTMKKIVIASGDDTERTVFTARASEFRTDLQAFAEICRLHKEAR